MAGQNFLVGQAYYSAYLNTTDGVIYKVDLRNCTMDSIFKYNDNIDDLALSPSGKLYFISNGDIFKLDANTLDLQPVGTIAYGASGLVCDTSGNLITIARIYPDTHYMLYYIDTLNASVRAFCPVDSFTGGDITFYGNDIYYDDESDFLHRVTLNPQHDYLLGKIACSRGSTWGLTTNFLDSASCEASMYAYDYRDICKIDLHGNSTPLCYDIVSSFRAPIGGAASTPIALCGTGKLYAVPDAFTPNGDGNNDYFQIYGNLEGLVFMEVQIFNRWGELVYQSNDGHFHWDGVYKGVLQLPQVFVYQIKLVYLDGHNPGLKKGSVTLIR